MDIISIAQHANPKPSGQIELRRAQFTALSSVVKIMPSSSSSLPKSSGLVSVTCLPRDTLIVTSRVFWHRRLSRNKQSIQTQLSCRSAREASLFLAALANATKLSPGKTRSVRGEPKETVRASGCFPNSNAGPIEVSKNDIRDEKDTSENEGRNQERLRLEMQLVRLRTMPHRQRANYKKQVSRYPNRGRDSGLRGDLPSDQVQTRQDQKSGECSFMRFKRASVKKRRDRNPQTPVIQCAR